MPTIKELSHGYDTAGVTAYIQAIKSQALLNAQNEVKNIQEIIQCCEDQWEGKACENFKHNLKKDAEYVSGQFEVLYNVLCSEIASVNAAMANKDETLIQED